MTRSRVLVGWSLVGVPVVFLSSVAWAIAVGRHEQPSLPAWRARVLEVLFAVLLLSGVIAMALSTRHNKSRWVVTALYGISMGGALIFVSTLLGFVFGDEA